MTTRGVGLSEEELVVHAPFTWPEIERFWLQVTLPDITGGCWQWIGRTDSGGYGRFEPRHKGDFTAHRVAYELLRGPIPAGLTLDHTCHTNSDCKGGDDCPHRACVNPAHLEPVTMRENTLRSPNTITGALARRTHCERGHELGGDNAVARSDTQRACAECRRKTQREWQAAKVPCPHCGEPRRRDDKRHRAKCAALSPAQPDTERGGGS